jgi:hypothetical protein
MAASRNLPAKHEAIFFAGPDWAVRFDIEIK